MTAPPGADSRGPSSLSTERLTLDPALPAHAELIIDDLRDERLHRFMGGPPRLRELRARFRETWRGPRREGDDRTLTWIARAAGEPSYAGMFEVTLSADGLANLAYVVFPRAQRRGYALEACRRIVSHLVEDHGVRAVVVVTRTDNAPARRLAERLGFRALRGWPAPGDGMVAYLFTASPAVAR